MKKAKALAKKGARKQKRRAAAVKATRASPPKAVRTPAPAPAPAWLLDLAVEWWRLERWAQAGSEERLVARHVARRIRRILDDHEIVVLDLTGNVYEAGLALEVVETVVDPIRGGGGALVSEMIAPIVLFKGDIVRHGQVVLVRGSE